MIMGIVNNSITDLLLPPRRLLTSEVWSAGGIWRGEDKGRAGREREEEE